LYKISEVAQIAFVREVCPYELDIF
jgi:hypothetical protein